MARNSFGRFEFDGHIISALLKLKTPIIGKNGKRFYVRDEARYESGLEHIANKRHRLKVKDIESLPAILRHPMMEMVDPNNKNYRNYYGVRKGKENDTLLKIVTWPDKNDSSKELIITVYPTKRYPAFLSSSESCPTARIWASSERAKFVLSERMGAVTAH